MKILKKPAILHSGDLNGDFPAKKRETGWPYRHTGWMNKVLSAEENVIMRSKAAYTYLAIQMPK
ncbi:MAG: hypothetical protein IKT01_01485 [Eubacteriaceae bacterium]|nr:hypothetical protein [Eubacteriaceae bacterium]